MVVSPLWENLELFSWVKDTKGRFISCTENIAQIAGADSPFSLSKKTDFDLIWRDRARLYLEEEHVVLLGGSIKVMQLQTTVSGTIEIVVTKYPLQLIAGF